MQDIIMSHDCGTHVHLVRYALSICSHYFDPARKVIYTPQVALSEFSTLAYAAVLRVKLAVPAVAIQHHQARTVYPWIRQCLGKCATGAG